MQQPLRGQPIMGGFSRSTMGSFQLAGLGLHSGMRIAACTKFKGGASPFDRRAKGGVPPSLSHQRFHVAWPHIPFSWREHRGPLKVGYSSSSLLSLVFFMARGQPLPTGGEACSGCPITPGAALSPHVTGRVSDLSVISSLAADSSRKFIGRQHSPGLVQVP